MFLYNKGQTSVEFITIILVMVLLAMIVITFLTSTFDLNIAVYKTKNKTLDFISKTNSFYLLEGVYYSTQDTDLNLFVVLNRASSTMACPKNPDDFNYSTFETELVNRTKFENVTVNVDCK
jgi:uncharacterized protein (UPF0333 family)